jgi:hypothetical protein
MGIFDTYHLAWGDCPEEIQTKQMAEPIMRSWHIGARVPLSELEEPWTADLTPSVQATEAACDILKVVIEDSSLGHGWHNPGLCERYFALGHFNGYFSDYCASFTLESGEILADAMRSVWRSPDVGAGLARRAQFIQERNAQAELSRARATANIDPLFRAWRQHLVSRGQTKPELDTRQSLMAMFRQYRGPDFLGLSRLHVAQAIEELCAIWQTQSMDFETALQPACPTNTAQHAASQCARSSPYAFISSGQLGAPSISELSNASEPAMPSGDASPQRASLFMRRGFWGLYELEAQALEKDHDFVANAKKNLSTLCASRIGSFWVAGFIARNPTFNFGHMMLQKEEIHLVDWMVARMGLPTRLAKPLMDIGAPASNQLSHYCLLRNHAELLNHALDHAGGATKVPPWNGSSLAVHAARTSSLAALRRLCGEHVLTPASPGAHLAIAESIQVEAREAASMPIVWDPTKPMSPALACAVYLHEIGLHAEGALSDRLRACLAMREKQNLTEFIVDIGNAPRRSSPRI